MLSCIQDIPQNTPRTSGCLRCLTEEETPIRGFGAVTSSVIPSPCGCFFQNRGSVFYPLGLSRPIHLSLDGFDVAWETQPVVFQAQHNSVLLPVAQPRVLQPGSHWDVQTVTLQSAPKVGISPCPGRCQPPSRCTGWTKLSVIF